uniref:Uncharacterized protein n=1 Tax=Cajanus cajan TaxID=3821 RepID=A0A151SZ49_CAJCA|nr:hypothetical protein KK1_015541 [Cajanus cajan]
MSMELSFLNEFKEAILEHFVLNGKNKHAFSYYPKHDVLMNNLSETFNNQILIARDKPIITMFEWIRTYLMGRFVALNEKLSKYPGNVMPKPRKRLDKKVELSCN